jgi:hypothetical protein
LLIIFAKQYANRTVQVNQDGLKLNGTHQLLVYADYVNILGRSIHTLKKNTEALVIASKEIGLEANADKTKYTWSLCGEACRHVDMLLRTIQQAKRMTVCCRITTLEDSNFDQ